MNSLQQRAMSSVTVVLILTLLMLPLNAANLSARAAPLAQEQQPAGRDGNVEILSKVYNSDGTVSVTVRIYTSPTSPDAPNTNFWVSQDSYIASGFPDNNYGSATSTSIGYAPGSQAMRMLLQFNLNSIPTYATINSATIYVYQYAASPAGDYDMGFQAQYAVSPWNEYNATWNNANYIGGATLPIGNFPGTLGWLAFPSTNLISTWISGAEPNYGLIITGDESPSNNRSRYFYSSNAGSNRPYVDINYTTSCAYPQPTSYVNALPATSPNSFTVSWTGIAYTPDGCPANGVSSYIMWYQVNNGDFVKWLENVPYTAATFDAASLGIGNGALVGFRSQAIDYYGNKQPAGDATASTTIQTVKPAATMNPLPTWINSSSFTVSWTGNAQGGPAIMGYDFQRKINNGEWEDVLYNTPQTSYQQNNAANGSNYQFRVLARNSAGTAGDWSVPTSTTIDTVAPSATMSALPQYTPSSSFWVFWSGSDANSGIAYYNAQYQVDGGAWQTLVNNVTYPTNNYYVQKPVQTGQVWGFRVQAVDRAGNVQPWSGSAQASTTIFINPLAVVQPFSPSILQSTAPVTKSFTVSWVGYTPAGTAITGYTVTYKIDNGPWADWITNTMITSAPFNWFDLGLTGNGIYQFKATASNNLNQAPYELPAQYWKTMIVDMDGKYQVRAYLPLMHNNTQ